jgi:hypothetical protein
MTLKLSDKDAQNNARKILIERHKEEFAEIYRSERIRLGFNVRPTKQEKIQKLKAEIAELEAK